jgi:hypothetical protein
MNQSDEADAKLTRLLDRARHELPLRRAPPTLESRVLAELERRAALLWWRHSFARWPGMARAVFVVTCTALAALGFAGGGWAVAGLRSLQVGPSMPWARKAVAVTDAAHSLAATLASAVPPDWIYGGMAVGAVLYAALFGLGAAAYRTLYLTEEIPGEVGS